MKSSRNYGKQAPATSTEAQQRLGIDINKKRLGKERPPRKTVDTSFEEIENAPVVQESLRFEPISIDREPGGNEAALLSIQDGGVYFVMAQVDGSQANFHAFVYDSTGTLDGHAEHSGMIIDNRRTSPVYHDPCACATTVRWALLPPVLPGLRLAHRNLRFSAPVAISIQRARPARFMHAESIE
eukprot:COSAG03_NODE_384_length_8325_cov_50.332726_12_plen_184_part_00